MEGRKADPEEKRREKARLLRYRKPAVKDINLEAIQCQLYDIAEACADVHWYCDSEDGSDTLLNALDGNEEDAWKFKMAFADLESQVERMQEDLKNEWLPDCFDLFFAGIGVADVAGGMVGWDAYEEDYFGMGSWESEAAQREAGKKLMRLTKEQLLEAAGACFRVAVAFLGLRSRYDDLKAALDILRCENTALLQQIKAIEEAYERAAEDEFYSWKDGTKRFDRLLAALPDRTWIE